MAKRTTDDAAPSDASGRGGHGPSRPGPDPAGGGGVSSATSVALGCPGPAEAPAETGPDRPTGLALEPAEAAVLPGELEAFAHTVKDPEARARYLRLGAAARQGIVPAEEIGLLEALLELLLQSQRVRRRSGPAAEQTLLGLFERTPRGVELRRAARLVNQALEALRGQRLEALSFAPRPAGHRLLLDTDRCRLVLAIDWAGVRVERLEVGG